MRNLRENNGKLKAGTPSARFEPSRPHAGRSPRTATSATEVQPKDHRNALEGNVLQKTLGSLWRKRKRAMGPASAPKLGQSP